MATHPAQGCIFNIQKFSIHDGPGIRTTVFLKGCPLRCLWCANPESQNPRPQTMGEAPDSRLYGVDEVLAVCLQDRAFYEESGGGVTISGGEPFVQWRFTVSLLEKLRQNGIHTAVETAGHVAPDLFCAAIADADLLLFDIKHHDEKRHREGTGIANGVILHNLAHCMAIGKDVLPRIPVIPGYNDAIQDAEGFADLLQHMGETAVQLLPFHQLGDKKYDLLGRSYAFKEKKPLYEKDLTAYRDAFLQKGIRAFF